MREYGATFMSRLLLIGRDLFIDTTW